MIQQFLHALHFTGVIQNAPALRGMNGHSYMGARWRTLLPEKHPRCRPRNAPPVMAGIDGRHVLLLHVFFPKDRVCYSMSLMRFSIIIPAYNEGAHIERVVRDIDQELQKVESDFEIIVVDNGSSDKSPEVLETLQKEMSHLHVHRVVPNRGYGGGILAGLSVAHGDVVGWTDGDGQVRAEDLGGMYEKMRQENLVFLKARRVTRHDGLFRIIQSNIFNLIFHILFFTLVNDVNAKPKLFRRSFYATIDLVSADMFIDAEIVIKALRSGIQIKEYPIVFESRKEGASKIHIGAGLEFIKNLLYYRFIKL